MNNPKDQIWMEKYRAKTLDDLVLEESTRDVLTKFINQDSIPHLLLSGNVGTGKTTIAKILLSIIDCDSIIINASMDRGIQVIRDRVKQFAMMSSFKKWKIIFLDEADAITPDAQFSLRNIMETYAEHTRFILTCNYVNKVIEPIRSRCQCIEFQNLGRKQIRVLLEKMLKNENVTYDVDDLLVLIDIYYPDIRSMINGLQLNSLSGSWKLKGMDSFRNFEQLLQYVKKGDLKSIRELTIDYVEAYKYIFDKAEVLTEDYGKRIDISLEIAEFLYRDVFIADKSINFAACMMKVMEKLK